MTGYRGNGTERIPTSLIDRQMPWYIAVLTAEGTIYGWTLHDAMCRGDFTLLAPAELDALKGMLDSAIKSRRATRIRGIRVGDEYSPCDTLLTRRQIDHLREFRGALRHYCSSLDTPEVRYQYRV